MSLILSLISNWLNCSLEPPLLAQLRQADRRRGRAGKAYILRRYLILQLLLAIFHILKTQIHKYWLFVECIFTIINLSFSFSRGSWWGGTPRTSRQILTTYMTAHYLHVCGTDWHDNTNHNIKSILNNAHIGIDTCLLTQSETSEWKLSVNWSVTLHKHKHHVCACSSAHMCTTLQTAYQSHILFFRCKFNEPREAARCWIIKRLNESAHSPLRSLPPKK